MSERASLQQIDTNRRLTQRVEAAEKAQTAPWRRLSQIAAIAPSVLGEDGEWLADAIRNRLAGSCPTLDAALCLSARGGVSPTLAALNDARNNLLREYASRFLANEAKPELALFMAIAAFETRQWPRLSARSNCPPQLAGTASGLLFELFKLGGRMPGPKRLKAILRNGKFNGPLDFQKPIP